MGPDVAKKRGDESKNYVPSIPPTRIPFSLTPDHFYVRFRELSVLHFLLSFFSFLDPIGPHWTPLAILGEFCIAKLAPVWHPLRLVNVHVQYLM